MPESLLTIRLDEDIVERLDVLARRTGRTPTSYAIEAITTFLDDHDDHVLATDSLEAFEASGEKALDIKDIDWDSTNR